VSFNQFSFDPRIAARIKTAAFILPILQRLNTGPLRRVRVLIVTPTRELAEQIHDMTREFSQNSKVRSVSVYGGVSKASQASRLRNGAEIVIACPGRLLDIAGDGDIDLSRVEVLVLDEADRMIDMGFLPDIRRILKLLPPRRQNLFFAATMPKDIRKLAGQILQDPVTVQIGEIAPAKTVSHVIYPVAANLKKSLLLAMLEQTPTGRVLVFTRTKHRARNLARALEKGGHRAAALQGNMSQNARQRSINGFRKGKYDILAATDVASRGIDVSEISHVINFDIPNTVDDYTHRIGRTGRARRTGEAFTFAARADETMVRAIEKKLGTRIERRRLPDFNYGESVSETPYPESKPKPRPGTVSNRKRSQARRNGRSNNYRQRSKRRR
jgi:ATP-dependent RNA helicase RhlE